MSQMTPKQYLSRALKLDREINRKIDRLGDLYAACTKSTSLLTLTPGGGHDNRAFEARMEKFILLRDEINADIDRLVDLKTEIREVIDAVPDTDLRLILEERYLNWKPWEQIAVSLGYNLRYIHKLHRQALGATQIPES